MVALSSATPKATLVDSDGRRTSLEALHLEGAIPENSHVRLENPLEELGDLWPVLRQIGSSLAPGSWLTVRYATGEAKGTTRRLHDSDVANLLRLTGFVPGSATSHGEGREMVGFRISRPARPLSCSVIIPCRNEVENVQPLVERIPELGTHTEIVFVDGRSTDGTADRVELVMRERPDRDIKLLRQRRPPGKAGATFDGFDAASGDILIILDADMTVAPEDLPRFYLALAEGVARFANGTRFLYPMASGAMPQLNSLGNRLFGCLFSWALGTPLTDTLCGTKALFRDDWKQISAARSKFGSHDPWGDFDLLLGAGWCGLDIVEVAVPYGARMAGESKMRPLRHGITLALALMAGIRELKLRRTSHGNH